MSASVEEARAALRVRQGAGARYDAPAAPARELDWARRGTAYFARVLGNLADAELAGSSAREGFSRRQLIAFVGMQARLLAETVAWMRRGESDALPFTLKVSAQEVAFSATLPPAALRYLYHHAAVHLDVEWRDATDVDWDKQIRDRSGQPIDLRQTPLARAATLWRLAVDIGAGGRIADIPAGLRLDLKETRAPILAWDPFGSKD